MPTFLISVFSVDIISIKDWKQGITPRTKIWYPKSTGPSQLAIFGGHTSEQQDANPIKTALPQMHYRPGRTEQCTLITVDTGEKWE